jgi:hypothetical protein
MAKAKPTVADHTDMIVKSMEAEPSTAVTVPPPVGVVFEALEGTTFVTHDNGIVQIIRGSAGIVAAVPVTDMVEYVAKSGYQTKPPTQMIEALYQAAQTAHVSPTPCAPNTLEAACALPLLIGQEQHFAFLPHLPIQAFRDTDDINRLVVQLENGTYAKA